MLEAILVGQTTVPCYQFEEKYKKLQDLDGKLGISRLEQQFNVSGCIPCLMFCSDHQSDVWQIMGRTTALYICMIEYEHN